MRQMVTIIVMALVSLLLAMPVQAKPQIVAWQMPTVDCDGAPLAAIDLVEFEIIYSSSPMPMPSDTDGPCSTAEDPEAPAGAITVPVPVTETSTLLNLQPGQTYYFRARVSAYINGNWSSWAAEIDKTVPYGRPDRVILSDGGLRFTSYLFDESVIRLN